jgi:hypothetical protein
MLKKLFTVLVLGTTAAACGIHGHVGSAHAGASVGH